MKDQLNILFTIDKGYEAHLATALYSLFQNNQSCSFSIHIISTNLERKVIPTINEIVTKSGSRFFFYNVSGAEFDDLTLNHHFKKTNYLRLLAADILTDSYCLYLDADLIVVGSIKELFEIDLGKTYLAAVQNPGMNWQTELGMRATSRCFNSGVMLINLAKWRKDNLKESVIELVRERPQAIRYVDQCGLNGIVNGNWFTLPKIYNFHDYFCSAINLNLPYSESININDLRIIHFTGSSKPWHLNNHHPFKRLYWKYRNYTPYRGYLSDDFGLRSLANYLLRTVIMKSCSLNNK